MIYTELSLSVSGQSYEEILNLTLRELSDFFNMSETDVVKKFTIEVKIDAQTDSLEFDEDNYVAKVLAKGKDV